MSLPIRTTLEDIRDLCKFFATKPTGATIKEAKSILDSKRLDGRKVSALKFWGLLEEPTDDRIKVTDLGRRLTKSESDEAEVLKTIIKKVPAYTAIVERAVHRKEDSLDTTEIAAHWHEHFKSEVGDTDKIIKDQAVCFFRLAEGAGIGSLIQGRKGGSTRFAFEHAALKRYTEGVPDVLPTETDTDGVVKHGSSSSSDDEHGPLIKEHRESPRSGQGIFIAHGKNRKPVEQLKQILDQFKIPYKVAVEEPNLGRPISAKVRDIMEACNCAVLVFSADEGFKDATGNQVWRPSENVVYELGAAGYLYDNRIVILKEEGVSFPANFRDLGYIEFEKDQLDAKAIEVVKELVGFKIIRFST